MIFGNGFCAATMVAIGGIYASGANSTEHGRYAVIALIYLFLIGFCSTTAIMCRIYVTEIQPIKTRAAASSLSLSANWVYFTHPPPSPPPHGMTNWVYRVLIGSSRLRHQCSWRVRPRGHISCGEDPHFSQFVRSCGISL